ncbi:alanine--tRNA ligase [Patescibacteria group bacterium]|nr:alanine--tRNA ligase [Patescibacteria group bacterium]
MKTQELVQKYISFFEEKGHKQLPNVSLVPEGDSTLLFVNSGMFPLVPYLMGEKHPLGTRLVNIQRSVRFEDLGEIGDPRHTIAFHMMGNWSLGDYFKKEQLNWFYEFLIESLGLDPQKIYPSVFTGDEDAPKDRESIEILKEIFSRYGIEAKLGERIFEYGKKSNWWQRGDAVGELGGPDSEAFYYIGEEGKPESDPEGDEGNFLEIGNSVFLQYKKTENGWEELPQKNVDFGGGLERMAMVLQNKKDIFETDNFWPIIEKIQEISGKDYYESEEVKKSMRIIADHSRACVFLAMDGVSPSKKERGYVLRRLLRRIVRLSRLLGIQGDISVELVGTVCEMFRWLYSDLPSKRGEIEALFKDEERRAKNLLARVSKKVRPFTEKPEKEQMAIIFENGNELVQSGFVSAEIMSAGWAKLGFDFHQSDGYALEDFFEDLEIAKKTKSLDVDIPEVCRIAYKLDEEHKQKSREGAEQKFKGGLADQSEQVVKYHTATHLLQEALRRVLGDHVRQIGSNITGERLRFDFAHDKKLTQDELERVTELVNSTIKKGLPVKFEILPKEEAQKIGALYLENEQYPETVKVYYTGESLEDAFSKEFCGGPHVENTAELEPLELYKQERIGEGKLRVYGRF